LGHSEEQGDIHEGNAARFLMAGIETSRRLPVLYGGAAVFALLLLAVISGLFSGDIRMSAAELFEVLRLGPGARPEEAILHGAVWRIRIPRLVSALISGAILSSGGVIFQGVLRGPLGDGGSDRPRVILAGVIAGGMLGVALTLIKAPAGERALAMVMRFMGSFSNSSWLDCAPLFFGLSVLLIVCSSYAQELDIMTSGADSRALGLDARKIRIILSAGALLAVSIVVSRFGVICFVGLTVPRLFRSLFGPPHHRLIPFSLFGGAALLAVADAAAKSMNDLPVGVLSVLVGGPIFCFILWRRKPCCR
jgi:iron complex transport system permease protein